MSPERGPSTAAQIRPQRHTGALTSYPRVISFMTLRIVRISLSLSFLIYNMELRVALTSWGFVSIRPFIFSLAIYFFPTTILKAPFLVLEIEQ